MVTSRVGGKKKKRRSRFYWAKYRDADGVVARDALKLPNGQGIRDKDVAQSELRRLLTRLERQAAGLVDPLAESATLPLRTVLAGYMRYLRGLRRTSAHLRKTLARIKWLAETKGMIRLGDVTSANVSKALDVLTGRGRAPKTINDYRAAMFGCCQWAIKVARILDRNPVEPVPVRDVNGDIRKVRRALTPDEARRFLGASPKRALWYETSMCTGLRVKEMRLLTWADLSLDGAAPGIELRAETTKARRGDFVPLRQSLVGKLAGAKPADAKSTDRAFRTTPTLETFRRHLQPAQS